MFLSPSFQSRTGAVFTFSLRTGRTLCSQKYAYTFIIPECCMSHSESENITSESACLRHNCTIVRSVDLNHCLGTDSQV